MIANGNLVLSLGQHHADHRVANERDFSILAVYIDMPAIIALWDGGIHQTCLLAVDSAFYKCLVKFRYIQLRLGQLGVNLVHHSLIQNRTVKTEFVGAGAAFYSDLNLIAGIYLTDGGNIGKTIVGILMQGGEVFFTGSLV